MMRVADVLSHERDACTFAPVRCPHVDPETEEECTFEGPRASLGAHVATCPLRPIECVFCGTVTAADNAETHAASCDNAPTPCTAGCGLSLARCEVTHHLETDCPEAETRCPFAGCGARMRRADQAAHAEGAMATHLAGERAAREALQRRMNDFERHMRAFEARLTLLVSGAAGAWEPPPPQPRTLASLLQPTRTERMLQRARHAEPDEEPVPVRRRLV